MGNFANRPRTSSVQGQTYNKVDIRINSSQRSIKVSATNFHTHSFFDYVLHNSKPNVLYWSENSILALSCPLICNFMTVGKYVFLSLLSLNFEPRNFEPISNICLQICNFIWTIRRILESKCIKIVEVVYFFKI